MTIRRASSTGGHSDSSTSAPVSADEGGRPHEFDGRTEAASPMDSASDEHADLAARQAQIVAALTGLASVPAGFDARHLDVARRALLRKRANELQFVWPILIASLGPRLHPLFAEFARERPTRGSRADGHAFAQWLRRRGALPLAANLELAEARLFWTFPTDTSGRPTAPVRRTSRVAVERFPGGMLVRRGRRVTTLGRPSER